MTDPTLPGIPQDAVDHAANVERARALVPHMPEFAGVADAFAEALTAAELRGFAAGVASVPTPAPKKSCRWCAHDRGGTCAPCDAQGPAVHWYDAFVHADRVSHSYPDDDADNCPGWAPKSTETMP